MENICGRGFIFFAPKQGKVNNFPTQNTAKSTNVPFWVIFFSDLVDNAPNRGYNVITVKENKAKLPETGQGGFSNERA